MTLCDDDLAAAADSLGSGSRGAHDHYVAAYARAAGRLSAAIREIASEPRFREAVAWQEPAMLEKCLDRVAAGKPGDRQRPHYGLVIARYLQRYCLSNGTQGFAGPVGWARVGREGIGLSVTPGPRQLARRTTYFEWRAIDVLATAIASRPEVLPWLAPRFAPSAVLDRGVLLLPFRAPLRLSADDARMLRLCDGTRTVRMLIGDPPDPESLARLQWMRALGAVQVGFQVPVSSWPERELADLIGSIADLPARGRALEQVARLAAARDEVTAAAGDAARVYRASSALTEAFAQVTGARAESGGWAGRPLVYEDAVRDVDLHIGRHLTDMLAPPLRLLLESAAWLVNAIATRYRALFWHIASEKRGGNGTRGIPLLAAAVMAMPELFLPSGGLEPAVVAGVVADFQKRWHQILQVPPGVRRHQVASADIAAQVAREFAAGHPMWSGAKVHSLDVMIAAPDPDAASRGQCQLVLGKLRPATNVLESRVFTAQHPDPGRLLPAVETDYLGRRIYAIPKRDSPVVTSRLCPPSALLSPRYTYLHLGGESVVPPRGARILPAADLLVEAQRDDLIVRQGTNGQVYDFVEVIGDMLTALMAQAFRPLAAAGHQPRISIDTMVIGRESWTFPAAAAAWAFVKDERKRYAAARQWRASHGIPERVFVHVPGDNEPTAVDFRSLPLVGLLGGAVRRALRLGRGDFTITEMLPDVGQLWLRDTTGDRYTAELKFVAVDGRAR